MRSDNFVQKINSYFYSISAPIVIVIDSFQDVLKVNKAEILEFLIRDDRFQRVVIYTNGIEIDKYIDLIPIDISARVNSKVFCPRNDWQAWRN